MHQNSVHVEELALQMKVHIPNLHHFASCHCVNAIVALLSLMCSYTLMNNDKNSVNMAVPWCQKSINHTQCLFGSWGWSVQSCVGVCEFIICYLKKTPSTPLECSWWIGQHPSQSCVAALVGLGYGTGSCSWTEECCLTIIHYSENWKATVRDVHYVCKNWSLLASFRCLGQLHCFCFLNVACCFRVLIFVWGLCGAGR
jgi:hypothetical protein